MLRRLEELSNLIGVSGDEGGVRRYIKAELADIDGLDMKTDAMGNLIVHKAGKGPKVMVAAHMDEVGMIVIGALDNGLIAYGQRGIDSRVVVSKRVLVGDEMIEGVIGAKAIHLQTAADRKTVLGHSELFVDIGAKDKDDALKYVKPGDRIGFATKFKRLGEKRVMGKALDDRVGCAILMQLLANDYECDFYGVFTVQEEVGLRGAASMAFALDPGFAMVLEGTTAADLAEVEGADAVCRVRGGVVLPFMDGATIYDAELFELLRNACDKRGIRWQTKTRVAGGTDAGRIHKSRAGVRVCAAAAPVRYIHSPSSVAAVADCEAVLSAARAFLEELGGDDE